MTTPSVQQQGAAVRRFKAGEVLFNEGDPSHCLFLIQKGTVAIRKKKLGGYIELARIHPRQIIGELSFFDRLPRSASAVALNDVETLEISFDGLDKVYAGVPDYMKSIIAALADRLRRANETIRRLQKDEAESEIPGDIPADDGSAPIGDGREE